MKLIKKVDESDKSRTYIETIKRTAARAVIVDSNKILASYLKSIGEYKLPGGGVKKNETLIDALRRETLEEVGYVIDEVIRPIGKIIQKYPDKDNNNNLFVQTSYYYLCSVKSEKQAINPSENEQQYDMYPVWEEIDKVIDTNKKNIHRLLTRFSVRELFMFDYIKKEIINKTGE